MGAPGTVRPLANFQGWQKGRSDRRTIGEKSEGVVRGIERWLGKGKGAASLEQLDPAEGVPVIRVLYASKSLPLFNGSSFAVIDPACDRQKFWAAIIDEVTVNLASSLEKRRARLRAA